MAFKGNYSRKRFNKKFKKRKRGKKKFTKKGFSATSIPKGTSVTRGGIKLS